MTTPVGAEIVPQSITDLVVLAELLAEKYNDAIDVGTDPEDPRPWVVLDEVRRTCTDWKIAICGD